MAEGDVSKVVLWMDMQHVGVVDGSPPAGRRHPSDGRVDVQGNGCVQGPLRHAVRRADDVQAGGT
jgi:hypothetical protein